MRLQEFELADLTEVEGLLMAQEVAEGEQGGPGDISLTIGRHTCHHVRPGGLELLKVLHIPCNIPGQCKIHNLRAIT